MEMSKLMFPLDSFWTIRIYTKWDSWDNNCRSIIYRDYHHSSKRISKLKNCCDKKLWNFVLLTVLARLWSFRKKVSMFPIVPYWLCTPLLSVTNITKICHGIVIYGSYDYINHMRARNFWKIKNSYSVNK